MNVAVRVADASPAGVDMGAALGALREAGVRSLLVEGGSAVITSLLAGGFADRIVVSVAPVLLGRGVEAVSDLGVTRVADGVGLSNRSVYLVGDDVVMAWDVAPSAHRHVAPAVSHM